MSGPIMETLLIFGVVGCGVFSLVSRDLRRSFISTWITGLLVGSLLLSRNMEYLGVALWVVSTIATLGGLFFGVTFGEYGVEPKEKRLIYLPRLALSLLVGGSFSSLLFLAGRSLVRLNVLKGASASVDGVVVGATDGKLFLIMIALGFAIFLSLVALGTITRLEKVTKEGLET